MPRKSSADRHAKVEVPCTGCGVTILRRPRDLKRYGIAYCTHACHMRFKNAAGMTVNISGEEKIFTAALIAAFPKLDIRLNDRTFLPDGLEVDIHIPALRLAIEINGPIHTKPMFGGEKLAAVQANDRRKEEYLLALGYRLVTIPCDCGAIAKSQRAAFILRLFREQARPVIERQLAA